MHRIAVWLLATVATAAPASAAAVPRDPSSRCLLRARVDERRTPMRERTALARVPAQQTAVGTPGGGAVDEVASLINQLQEARPPAPPSPDGAAAGRDLTVGDLPRPGWFFMAGMTPDYDAPAMERLAALGARALPGLVDHLTDARETKVVVKRPAAMWFSDEYDPRYRDP